MASEPRTSHLIDPKAAAAIVAGDHSDPFGVLGMHGPDAAGGVVVRAFHPHVDSVAVVDARSGDTRLELQRIHPAGLFAGRLPAEQVFPYRLRFAVGQNIHEAEDPYRFPPLLGDLDLHLLAEGTHRHAYRKLGAHFVSVDGINGVGFAVWAPNASRVSVVGSFNQWDGRRHPMRYHLSCGVWEIFIPGITPGTTYKYEIKSSTGDLVPLKADPFAFYAERPPGTSSIVYDLSPDHLGDNVWLARRPATGARDAPISIYEVHLGSWRRRLAENRRYLTYGELADELIPYVRDLGFTHIELMPVSEHPFDGSWGYQPIGLFAPTSRFGSPDQFRDFIDRCHDEGIGVIIDWVAGHFPTDPHGLEKFDGTALYEHADPRQGRHRDWDTLIFNYGRREVATFYCERAVLARSFPYRRTAGRCGRLDALSRLQPQAGGVDPESLRRPREPRGARLPATAQRSHLCATAMGRSPSPRNRRPGRWYRGRLISAASASATSGTWAGCTTRSSTCPRIPLHRQYHHDNLTFGLLYAFSENFVLPLSHDEVVHGKGSLIGRMAGDLWQKFANLRLCYAFLYSQPGKKLLFMGGEIAQQREWNHDIGLDWQLLEDPLHAGMQRLVRDLNHLYRSTRPLHELDCEPEGFEWIDCHDAEQSVISYIRRGKNRDQFAVIVCNFTPVVRSNYRIGVPRGGYYREAFNSDSETYGGSNLGNLGGNLSDATRFQDRPYSLVLTLPPLATLVLMPQEA